jgi:hypothetical protein
MRAMFGIESATYSIGPNGRYPKYRRPRSFHPLWRRGDRFVQHSTGATKKRLSVS